MSAPQIETEASLEVTKETEEQRRRRRRGAWLAGGGLAAVLGAGSIIGQAWTADDLEPKAEDALQAAGFEGVEVSFLGREASLRGPAGMPAAELDEAKSVVEGIRGVRWASIEGEPAAAPDVDVDGDVPSASLSLARTVDGVTLDGAVPSADVADALTGDIGAAFGDVDGELSVDPDVSSPDWLGELPDLFDGLSDVPDLGIDIENDTLTLTGSVPTEAELNDVERAVVSALPDLTIDNQLTVEDVDLASPSLSLARTVDGVTLDGAVPSADVADALTGDIGSAFGDVDGELSVDPDVGSPDWLGELPDLFDGLSDVPDLGIDIENDTLTLTGTVPTEADIDQIGDAVAAALPELTIDNQLTVDEDAVDEGAAARLADAVADISVLFDFDSSAITGEAAADLDEMVAALEDAPGVAVEMVGHTDSVGDANYNVALAERRADAVVDYLVDAGIDADRFTTVSEGQEDPVADNADPGGRAQNRRVSFTVTQGAD